MIIKILWTCLIGCLSMTNAHAANIRSRSTDSSSNSTNLPGRVLEGLSDVSVTDPLAEFKNRNLLKDEFSKSPIQLNAPQSLTLGGSTIVSLNNLQPLPSVFAANAEYFVDGVKQASLPPNALYSSPTDDNVVVVVPADGGNTVQRAIRNDPVTGKVTSLLPMEWDLQVFTEVDDDDIDPEKIARFHFGENDQQRRFLDSIDVDLDDYSTRELQACSSYKTIQVAIAYESRFCQFMGGSVRANEVVQLTVAQTSLKFQKPGLCTKVVLSHLEGYCDPKSDPYHNMFAGSVCKTNDSSSILSLFRNYWIGNRSHVKRDVAHLFHGFAHASGAVGCAFSGVLCDKTFGYGVNELTFGGNNNPHFWTILFAHELGHSAGASHMPQGSNGIMDPLMCPGCNAFSGTSVAYMRNHIDSVGCLDSSGGNGIQAAPAANNNNNNDKPNDNDKDKPDDKDNGVCLDRLQYCNMGQPCCEPWYCYNRFVCL